MSTIGADAGHWDVEAAAEAMATGALVYVDIRSRGEVEAGLPRGAWHVPLFDADPGGRMTPNLAFVAEVTALTRHVAPARCAVACAHGIRSRQARGLLAMAGVEVDEVPGGWDGLRDGMGRVLAAGWSHRDLPIDPQPPPERDHAAVARLGAKMPRTPAS